MFHPKSDLLLFGIIAKMICSTLCIDLVHVELYPINTIHIL